MSTIYTIGHSVHTIEHFIEMLRSFDIQVLADIRSKPGSKRHPQYNLHAFSRALEQAGIKYIHMGGLGAQWERMSYSEYMKAPEFEKAIAELQQIATTERTAYMCAEANWRNCHRALVSDYLTGHQWQVQHIMGVGVHEEHQVMPVTKSVQGDLFS